MANNEHVALLKRGIDAWNAWRNENAAIRPDLSKAALREVFLRSANLTSANLDEADLRAADLRSANLSGASLARVNFRDAYLREANLSGAILSETDLTGANLSGANLSKANLRGAKLWSANLVSADLRGADLAGCFIHGVSAWRVKLDTETNQQNLIITHQEEPEITVDNIEVAQFVYLLLHNPKIRDVIDTIGRKAVLILGRFTQERKAVLNALREELRRHDYVPILFDFEKPASRDLTATVSTLAHMARFIIADLTDPSSIPYELATVVPNTPIPVTPILQSGNSAFAMFEDLRQRHHWVLPIHRYRTPQQLIATLAKKVIAPAEKKAEALQKRRRNGEAELVKHQ